MDCSNSTAVVGLRLLLLLVVVVSSSSAFGPTPARAAVLDASSQQLTISQQQNILAAQQAQLQSFAAPQLAVPELVGYNFNNAKDTFDLCHETSGLLHDVSLEALLPVFKLPADLTRRRSVTLEELINLLHDVQPDFKVVWQPMLFGEPDIGSLLSPGGLPRLVHFTVKDKNDLAPHQVVSMASWAYYNPGHSLMLFDDLDIHQFMTSYYPELLPTFEGLSSQVERTDMWRYLVLCKMGGVYADSDVVCARPVSNWVQDAGLLVGIENVFTTPEEAKRRDYTRQIQMVQWAIASRKGHPVVCRMGQYVAAHVAEEKRGEFIDPDRNHAILERTGPGIWSSSVHDYIREAGSQSVEQLVAGAKVGDVRILPQPVFGCASATFNPEYDPYPYVYHMFKGSWRAKHNNKVMSFISTLYQSMHHKQQHTEEEDKHDALEAAAVKAAAEAAEFARNQQIQRLADTTSGDLAAAAAPAVQKPPALRSVAKQLSTSAAVNPHPRLPILDEQILEHKKQQLLKQQEELLQRSLAVVTAAAPGASKRQRQAIRLDAGQRQQQLSAEGAGAAAAATVPVARKLRSSQLLLVRGISPATTTGVPIIEPELPSSALSSMPVLSVLVLVVVVCALYKQQQGSSLLAGLSGWAGKTVGTSRGLCSSVRVSNSGFSRPGSRVNLAGAGGNSAVLPTLATASVRLPLPERPQSCVQESAEVTYASNKTNHPHRHKRSWGSSSNFQQL
eukprot:GHUV01003552.1.p1 GENE.GHUV01003552.1~~GHUV01003552.1.p1  ORF type:complete len:731 (+),score=251.47 GHUV01003552.1:314-2506(+)